jgi:sterol desaturase/sphingolipid hydroxylase (fatty acid hydroxylase superfamily)
LPSAGEIVAKLVVYALLEDYLNYWMHRFLQTTWGYTKFHYVHHELTTPTGFAAVYVHWAELTIFSINTIVILAIVPCHVTTHWLWYAIRTTEAIETHSG